MILKLANSLSLNIRKSKRWKKNKWFEKSEIDGYRLSKMRKYPIIIMSKYKFYEGFPVACVFLFQIPSFSLGLPLPCLDFRFVTKLSF